MSKDEAIAEMKKGVKITHEYFSKEEWMTQVGCKIHLEDGVKCYAEEFWAYRKGSSWETGYSIFKN